MNPPFEIDDPSGCFCPMPCVNCMREVVIYGSAETFVQAFEDNELEDFFADTSLWYSLFPFPSVPEDFGDKVISGDYKFIKRPGVLDNTGQDIYIAIHSNVSDTAFSTEDVVIALPIIR